MNAIWLDRHSTDVNPGHDLCCPGKDSFCGLNKILPMGTSNYQHDHPLPEAVANAILPKLVPLSDEDLLHGGTQNQHEVINALIWQHATKETHPGVGSCCEAVVKY